MLNEKGLPISEQIRPKEEYVVWEPGEQHEVEVVKRIFEMRTKQRYGYTKIAKILNADRTPCPQRGKWMNKDQKWSSATVGAIIKNPTYMGARAYNRLRKRGIGKFAPRYWVKDHSEWTIVENSHPFLVSPDQWKTANPATEHTENGRRAITRFDSPYLLSGLISCPHCNFNFSGRTQTIGPPGKRHTRRTYTDSGYVNKGPTVCVSFSVDADKLEKALMEEIEQRIASSSVKDKLQSMIDNYLTSKASPSHDEIEETQTALLRLNNQISSLITLAEKGVKLEEVAKRIKQLESERSVVEAKVKHLKCPKAARMQITKAVDETVAFFGRFKQDCNDVPISERKSLVRQIVDRIVIDRDRRVAKCYLLAMPRSAGKIVEEMIQDGRTHLMSVPPTRFELVLQA